MGFLTFYENHPPVFSGEPIFISLRHSDRGGVEVWINGHELPGVISYRISPRHPFPRIQLQVIMTELSWEDGIVPTGLDDDKPDIIPHQEAEKQGRKKGSKKVFIETIIQIAVSILTSLAMLHFLDVF